MESLTKKLGAAVLGGSLLIGGAAGAYAVTGTAGAQESTTTTAAASTDAVADPSDGSATQAPPEGQTPPDGQAPPDGQTPPDGQARGPHTANGTTETLLTGSDLEAATAAAKTAVPDGTVERAETDADGDAYEVHLTTADGSHVTVKLDESFQVIGTEDGPGAPQGAPPAGN